MSLKVIVNCAIGWAICHFLLVICCNNISIVYRFRDNITFTVHVTDCNIEKSFNFDATVQITGHHVEVVLGWLRSVKVIRNITI